jgi:hypothetical protein
VVTATVIWISAQLHSAEKLAFASGHWANFSLVNLENDKGALEQGVDLAFTSFLKSMAAIRLFCETNDKAFLEASQMSSQILEKLSDPPLEPGPAEITIELTKDEHSLLVEVMEDHGHLLIRAGDMVSAMALIYTVALFDGLLVDLYRLCLSFVPRSIATRERTISIEQVMKANDIGILQAQLITEEVDRFAFKSVLEQFNLFRSRLGIEGFEFDLVAPLEGIRARRNIFVHNGGLVNESYVKIAGGSPFVIGEMLKLGKDDLDSDIEGLNVAAKSLVQAIRMKFDL